MMAEVESCIPDFVEKKGQKRELYLAPRYTYKTSIAIAFVVYLILRFPDISIAIYRASRTLAKDMLAAIQEILTRNPEILSTFGDLSAGSPLWTTFKLTVNTRTRQGVVDPTLTVSGLKSSMAGSHPDFVLMDDLVTEVNCDSIVEMDKARRLVDSAFPVLPLGWGSLLITGTAWSAIDVYWKIREKNKELIEAGQPPDFKEYIRKVRNLNADGELVSFFPRELTDEFLERQRLTITARMYAAWYFQEVVELGMAPFPKDRILMFEGRYEKGPHPHLFVDGVQDPIPLYVVLGIDPALTASASSDNFGINVVGFDPDKNWWVLESQEWRKLPSDATHEIIKLLFKYEPDSILIESANADVEMMERITRVIHEAGMKTVIRSYSALQDEPHGQRGKDQRILSLEPKFHQGNVKIRKGMCGSLLRELDNYPSLDHDDCLDQLAMDRKLEKFAPKERTVMGSECDHPNNKVCGLCAEKPDLFHERLNQAEIRPVGTGVGGGVPKGGWTGPLVGRS
jgi:predicted phage terminase large subunit-like protein